MVKLAVVSFIAVIYAYRNILMIITSKTQLNNATSLSAIQQMKDVNLKDQNYLDTITEIN